MTQPMALASLTARPAAGPDEPFGMLEQCHEKLQRMLMLLQRLREHLRRHGADTQAQQAARDILRYFDQAAPRHHEDEELHVFPPLLAQADPATVAVVQRLQHDHQLMERRWPEARAVLEAVASGQAGPLTAADEAILDAFAVPYEEHIKAEEQIVYPAAQAALGDAGRAAMSEDMARRRRGR